MDLTAMSQDQFSKNNFDLIRLLAALQVAVAHSAQILSPSDASATWMKIIELFPGVPTFFFISGFLISKSYERNPNLQDYSRNRALRIFPALHVCLVFNILLVAATGYFTMIGASLVDVVKLYVAKGTFFQFYNPDFMRRFGDGVLNGSLWTICVELQFYFLIPIIYRLMNLVTPRREYVVLLSLLVASLACNRLLYLLQHDYSGTAYWKLFRVSFLPWLYMFVTGILFQKNFSVLRRLVRKEIFWFIFVLYVSYGILMESAGFQFDNSISPLLTFPLFVLIFLAAFVAPSTSDAILRRNDISYGVYIYHMPIVNMFLYYSIGGRWTTVAACLLSVLAAFASWRLIERPTLLYKKRPLHAVALT